MFQILTQISLFNEPTLLAQGKVADAGADLEVAKAADKAALYRIMHPQIKALDHSIEWDKSLH